MGPKRKRSSSTTTKRTSERLSTKKINTRKSSDNKPTTNSKDRKDTKEHPTKIKGSEEVKYTIGEEVQYDPVHKGSTRRAQGKVTKVLTGAKKSDPSTKEVRYVIENDNTKKETSDSTIGSIILSNSSTSFVGTVYILSIHEKSCQFCEENRYEICSINTNKCQCPEHIYLEWINFYHCHWVTKWASNAISGSIIAGSLTGSWGSDSQSLLRPYAFALDEPNSFLYIVDRFNNCVQRFFMDDSRIGVTVASGNGQDFSPNQLYSPTDIYFSKYDYSIYIVDCYNNRIQKWNIK